MVGPRDAVLRYNLYVDAARRRVWGDGDSGGTARITGQSDGRKAVSFTIYGRIPDGQSVRQGSYRDSVKVSVSR
jgi:spore coat protein U-like protein